MVEVKDATFEVNGKRLLQPVDHCFTEGKVYGLIGHNGSGKSTLVKLLAQQKRIWEAKEKWPQTATALDTWYRLIKASEPKDFAAMKSIFPATDKVGRHHVFDIGGNKIRLIAVVHYRARRVYIRDTLAHSEYDKGKWKD